MRALSEIDIIRYENGETKHERDVAIAERQFDILLNGELFLTVMATPEKLEDLAAGLLFGEGAISSYADIISLELSQSGQSIGVKTNAGANKNAGAQRVRATGFGMGTFLRNSPSPEPVLKNALSIEAERVVSLMDEFNERSQLFRDTGAVHSCCLCFGEARYFADDVGRHNALDKVIGAALKESLDFSRAILLTTGRVSTEILTKTARTGACMLISRSAPTDRAVTLARELGMTLVGFARGRRFNIYSGDWRIQ